MTPRPADELMTRLERANPVTPDQESADDSRSALLDRVLAEPMSAKPPPRRAPRTPLSPRRIALAGACVAVLGLAALAALDLLDSEGDAPGGIVERAVAALSDENAIYAVTERSLSTITPLDGGKVVRERSFRRYWLWKAGKRSRFVDYRALPDGSRGQLLEDIAFHGDRLYWYSADTNQLQVSDRGWPRERPSLGNSDYPGLDPFSDPGAQLRRYVDDGRLRVAGQTTVRGRTAYRLVSRPLSNDKAGVRDETVTYLVDADNYLPLQVRSSGTVFTPGGDPSSDRFRYSVRGDYLSYEALPDSEPNRARLRVGRYPGMQRRRGVDQVAEPPPPIQQQQLDD